MPAWGVWLGLVALVTAALALIISSRLWLLHKRTHTGAPPQEAAVQSTPTVDIRYAFVVNPVKYDAMGLEEVVRKACTEAHLAPPLWYETTIEDPGGGPTRAALAAGADVVVAVGGDGTVRAVAEQLVGTGTPMGLIPVGTGNLLARNLDIPLGDVRAALHVAMAGTTRVIDVGWTRVTQYAPPPTSDGSATTPTATRPGFLPDADLSPDARFSPDAGAPASPRGPKIRAGGTAAASGMDLADGPPRDAPPRDTGQSHIFLVIAGLGFDAAMVADTDEQLKAKVGWVAYFVGGFRHLHGRRMRAQITLDDRPPVEAKLRSVLIGNCGRLPGGFTLLPNARIDDGILDVATVDTRGGLVGWAGLLGEIIMQGLGVRHDLPRIGRIDHNRARRVRVQVESGEPAQVDGDVLGSALGIESWIQPGALVMRVP
jgi:diacylglycerol kinase family enzyme